MFVYSYKFLRLGKSSVVHTLANLCSTKLHIFRMTEFFDVSELLGVYEPETLTDITNMLRHQLGCLIQSITECNDFMSSLSHIDSILERIATVLSFEDEFFVQKFLQNTDGVLTKDENFRFDFASELEALNNNCGNIFKKKSISQIILAIQRLTKILNIKIQGDKDTLRFKWTDGLLVQCVEQGDWILFQHAHLASPAFLDRLNSLLEPNGIVFVVVFLLKQIFSFCVTRILISNGMWRVVCNSSSS
jgi:midasin